MGFSRSTGLSQIGWLGMADGGGPRVSLVLGNHPVRVIPWVHGTSTDPDFIVHVFGCSLQGALRVRYAPRYARGAAQWGAVRPPIDVDSLGTSDGT